MLEARAIRADNVDLCLASFSLKKQGRGWIQDGLRKSHLWLLTLRQIVFKRVSSKPDRLDLVKEIVKPMPSKL